MNVAAAATLTLQVWKENWSWFPEPVSQESGVGLPHARWMLETVVQEQNEWKKDKLNRWLGYAQGVLVQLRVLSLEQVKECNRLA